MQLGQGLLAHSPMLFPLNRRAFQRVPDGRPSLDLGIGSGQNSRFSLQGHSLDVGADIILSNLLGARSIQSHERFAALDMCALPFSDGSFERVYALNCIYHAHLGREVAVAEMSRVLAPGGILALTDVSPFLDAMKPLAGFLEALGFDNLRADFTRYFLSGYGADSTPGSEEWYYSELPRMGFDDVRVQYLLSSRLSAISYLFYDWQALFNLDVHTPLVAQGSANRYWRTYSRMLSTVIAPLLQQDEEICRMEKKAAIFSSPREREPVGKRRCSVATLPVRNVASRSEEAWNARRAAGCFPSSDIPLLTAFYAESVRTST